MEILLIAGLVIGSVFGIGAKEKAFSDLAAQKKAAIVETVTFERDAALTQTTYQTEKAAKLNARLEETK